MKFVLSKQNNLGEVISIETELPDGADKHQLTGTLRPMLQVIDERFREMNTRLLGANAHVRQLPVEQQRVWYEALEMLYGSLPIPAEVADRVRTAVEEQGSEAFADDRQLQLIDGGKERP